MGMRIRRLRSIGVTAVAAVLAGSLLPASAMDPGSDLLTSDLPADEYPITTGNVTYHGTIPFDHPGVGGEVVVRDDLDGRTFFYATGAYGLSIYDVADPANPDRVGHLPFPHSQNEDLKVSDDGTRAVIAADGSLPFSPNHVTIGVHIIDTTDVTDPKIIGSTSPLVRGDGADRGTAEHTVVCADAACEYIYGSSTGNIYDATDPSDIKVVGEWNVDREGSTVGGRHALNRDASGLLVSDSNPRLVLDPDGVVDPTGTPTSPAVLAQGNRSVVDNRLQHNNIRTDALDWEGRDPDDPADAVVTETVEAHPRSISVVDERPIMRPGELFLGQSETNVNPQCNAGGGLSTWSMVNFDQGEELVQLEVFQPLNGTWADGSPAANVAGCSGHWFTENDGIVAGAWYEHGVRFFDVDKTLGTIEEIGFYQPVAGIASAAYWIDDEFVYSVDGPRGIDILSFDRDAPRPEQDELDRSWLSMLGAANPVAAAERAYCALAADN